MRILPLVSVSLLTLALVACDDPNSGLYDPIIRDDTVSLAIPTVAPEVPTALDIAYASSLIRGRYPELVSDAEQWDIALRREDDGRLVFVPARIFGFFNPIGGLSSAAITAPLNRDFAEVIEAPGRATLLSDSVIPIALGDVYVLRSRRTGATYGGCENYAKLQPISVDATAGLVTLRVVGNARCNDPRLAPKD